MSSGSRITKEDDASLCSTDSNSEYSTSPSFQLHPWSIAWFILALKMVIVSSCTVSLKHTIKSCYYGSRQSPTPWPRVHHLALPRMWSQSLWETLQTDKRKWTYLYLYVRLARILLLLQRAANRTLSKLSAEHGHCLFIVADVSISYKHVHEWRHRLSLALWSA